MGLTPHSPLIQNKNHPPSLFYPLRLLLGEKNFCLFTAPTFIWNPRGYHMKEVPRKSLRDGPLGKGPLGLGPAAGAGLRPQAGG